MTNPFDLLTSLETLATQSTVLLEQLQALSLEGEALERTKAALQKSAKVRQHIREQKVRLLRILLSMGALLPETKYNERDNSLPGLCTYDIQTANSIVVDLRLNLARDHATSGDFLGTYTAEEFVVKSERGRLHWESFCTAIINRLEWHLSHNSPAQASLVSQIVSLSDRLQALVAASV